MKDWFEWNGVRCASFGIHVSRQPGIIRPSERATFASVPGRGGALTTLEGEDVYDDFILSAECFITDLTQLSAISNWLRGSGTVTVANRTGEFYQARIVNQISFEQVLRGNPHRTFVVNFRCQASFQCIMTYGGKIYTDTISLIDKTDPYLAVIESSGGDVFKNGIGTSTLLCRLFQNGQEVEIMRARITLISGIGGIRMEALCQAARPSPLAKRWTSTATM